MTLSIVAGIPPYKITRALDQELWMSNITNHTISWVHKLSDATSVGISILGGNDSGRQLDVLFQGVSTMNLPTKLAYNPLFVDQLLLQG